MPPTPHRATSAPPPHRRAFLIRACGLAAGAGGAFALAGCGGGGSSPAAAATQAQAQAQAAPAPAPVAAAPTTTPEQDVLNFALNLQYLGAQFYAFAATGAGVAAATLTGTGAPGAAEGGRAVAFADPVLAQFVQEIAADKLTHLTGLRAALGDAAVAQPRIDLSAGAGGAFSAAAQAGGVVAPGAAFDPYASDANFLLAASMFEDVAAAAHRAALPLLAASSAGLDAQTAAAAGAAFHAGVVRAALTTLAADQPDVKTSTAALAAARARLDGSPAGDDVVVQDDVVTDVDDGDGQGVPFSRAATRALRVLYANPGQAAAGGFFPAGLNGTLRASA